MPSCLRFAISAAPIAVAKQMYSVYDHVVPSEPCLLFMIAGRGMLGLAKAFLTAWRKRGSDALSPVRRSISGCVDPTKLQIRFVHCSSMGLYHLKSGESRSRNRQGGDRCSRSNQPLTFQD